MTKKIAVRAKAKVYSRGPQYPSFWSSRSTGPSSPKISPICSEYTKPTIKQTVMKIRKPRRT